VWHVIGETSTQQQSARYRHPSSDIEQQQRRTRESGSNKDKPKLRNTESQRERFYRLSVFVWFGPNFWRTRCLTNRQVDRLGIMWGERLRGVEVLRWLDGSRGHGAA